MSFVEKCISDSIPIWKQCLGTEFLERLIDGTLPQEWLMGYIVDDSLYLREYAKVFAWGIIHARTMQEVRLMYSLLAFVNESEDSARLHYLDSFGIKDEQIQSLPLRAENRAYIDTMLQAAQNGAGIEECMIACLSCMLSYSWIFQEVKREHPCVLEGRYALLVRDYASDAYADLCRYWIETADLLCEEMTADRKERCLNLFRRCSEHEFEFWRMSGRPRKDLP